MVLIHASPVVTLTSDFGVGSPYVAQMKGVLLARNPELQLVDVTHGIPAQDIRAGALVLDDVCWRFPPHTIHVAVVDPGVGTQREIVYARMGQHQFIAPNNGLLTWVARRQPPDLIVSITNPLYFLPVVSATFHGRDIMAPIAAHLSLGLHPERLGPLLSELATFPAVQPACESHRISGCVLQVDSFGNMITNIHGEHLEPIRSSAAVVRIRCRSTEIVGISETYGSRPPGEFVALVGSNGRLELAVVQGDATRRLGVGPGEPVVVEWS